MSQRTAVRRAKHWLHHHIDMKAFKKPQPSGCVASASLVQSKQRMRGEFTQQHTHERLKHLCARPAGCDSLAKRRAPCAAHPTLTQGKVTWLLQEAASLYYCNPRACIFQPPQHELTDFNDYVITENFTTNMKIPSGGHIEDGAVHPSERGREAHSSQREEQRDLLNLKGHI